MPPVTRNLEYRDARGPVYRDERDAEDADQDRVPGARRPDRWRPWLGEYGPLRPHRRGEGNPSTTGSSTQARLMLRPALADRFSLVVRRETREIPVYALRQVRSDRGLGPQLRESPNCSGPATPLPAAPDALEPIPDFPCGTGFSRGGHLGARGSEFSVLVRQIATWTDRVLIDRTALTGRFDWDMQWTPEPLTPDISVVPNRLPLETALRDQLGFRLEARTRLGRSAGHRSRRTSSARLACSYNPPV